MSVQRILFVDDDPDLLGLMPQQLGPEWSSETASSGEEGLLKSQQAGAFPVVVSDLDMQPGMNGIAFLQRLAEQSPETVGVILTGRATVANVIEALNDGHIFRFLTKPVTTEDLRRTVLAARRHHEMITAERDLLEKTLTRCIEALTEVLSLANPAAFARAYRIRHYVRHIVSRLELMPPWMFEVAALTSQIGCVTLPPDLLEKLQGEESLTDEEQRHLGATAEIGAEILARIPRLERVAQIVRRQAQVLAEPFPSDRARLDPESMGALVLCLAGAIDRLAHRGHSNRTLVEALRQHRPAFPEFLLETVSDMPAGVPCGIREEVRKITVAEMKISMVLDEDVRTSTGALLVQRGQEVTEVLIRRFRTFAQGVGIAQPFGVRVRVTEQAAGSAADELALPRGWTRQV